jgi:hypothetical protein
MPADGFNGTERFALRRRLGTGGMGMVYEAIDRQQGARVALKTLKHLEPLALLRFKNEFRALADLEHPNLVRLGELFHEDGHWFFTMELLDGVDFLSWVRHAPTHEAPVTGHDTIVDLEPTEDGSADPRARAVTARTRGRLDVTRLRDALAQLAAGLDTLHAAGKVHRDVKPSNVLVTPRGRVVLLDFGLVTELRRPSRNSSDAIVGTAAYMSPEQAGCAQLGPASDWYSVGVTLYEALTGRVPFEGMPLVVLMRKQRREPMSPRRLAPETPEDLDELCMALLKMRADERLAGMQAAARLGAQAPSAPVLVPAASVTQATPFVGREAELAQLRAAWAQRRADEARAVPVFLVGESGIGKSALARRFLSELEAQELAPVVLTSRCYEREAVPYKAFDGLIDALSRRLSRLDQVEAALLLPHDASILARLFPVLRRVPAMAHVPEAGAVHNPQELRTRAFSALRELLTRLAERWPTAIFVDDFQWADADSLALLAHVMQGAHAPPILFLATLRAEAAPGILASIGAAGPGGRRIDVGALTATETRELVQALSGDDDPALAAEAAGHPLFVHELVRHAQSSPRHEPVRLDQALWARVERLDPQARALLEVIAIAGEPLAQPLAAQAAGLEPGECARLMGLLRAAHLVRSTGAHAGDAAECYHDRVREAVTARLAPDAERRWHAALAAALEATGWAARSPLALVRHLEAAGEPARAAELAERAARQAAEALAFDRAAELYRTTLRLGRHEREIERRMQIVLGDTLVFAGRGVEAAEIYLAAAEGADSAVRVECRRKAAEQLLGAGETRRGLDTIRDVLAELGETLPDKPGRAIAALLWDRARLRVRGLKFRKREPSELSPRQLARLDTYHAIATGLGMVDPVRASAVGARCAVLALDAGEPVRIARALGMEAVFQGTRGNYTRGFELAKISRALVRGASDPYLDAYATVAEGMNHYLSGEFLAADERFQVAERALRGSTIGTTWEVDTVVIFRGLALRHAGRLKELRAVVEQQVPDAVRRGDRYAEATLRRSGVVLALARDAPAEALAELERCAWQPPPGQYHMQNWYEDRARVEIDLYRGTVTGSAARAKALVATLDRSLLSRVVSVRDEAHWTAARLLLADAERRPADEKQLVAAAEREQRFLARHKVGYAQVWTLLVGAAVAFRRADRNQAGRLLRAAEAAAERAQMRVCGHSARLVRGLLVGGDDGAALAREAEAALAAEGVTRARRFAAMFVPGFGCASRAG